MARKSPTLEEVLTENGYIYKVEERGRVRGIEQGLEQAEEKFVRNLLKEGLTIEKIAAIAELPAERVRALAKKQKSYEH